MTLAVPKPGPIQDATGNLTRPWLDFIQALTRQAATGGDDATVLASMGSASPSAVSQLQNDAGYISSDGGAVTLKGALTLTGDTPALMLDCGVKNRARIASNGTLSGKLEILVNLSWDGTQWNLDDPSQTGTRIHFETGVMTSKIVFSTVAAASIPAVFTVPDPFSFDLKTGYLYCNGPLTTWGAATFASTLDCFGPINSTSNGFSAGGAGGVNGTCPLGPYTVGGTPGSITFTGGICTAFSQPS